MTVSAERSALHRLVDMLPDRDLDAATNLLRDLLPAAEDPVLRAFWKAPEDDEELSGEDQEALAEASADAAARRVLSDAEFCRRMGL
jgi:hypothetical protein